MAARDDTSVGQDGDFKPMAEMSCIKDVLKAHGPSAITMLLDLLEIYIDLHVSDYDSLAHAYELCRNPDLKGVIRSISVDQLYAEKLALLVPDVFDKILEHPAVGAGKAIDDDV